jgi:hypothetical protein
MPSDIRLRDEEAGSDEWLVVEGSVFKTTTSDVMVDSPQRRSGHGGRFRRAFVHDFSDGLTINFARDYPGGVTILNAKINLHHELQTQPDAELPKQANVGDLRMIHNSAGGEFIDQISLWVCVPGFGINGNSMWQRIQMADDTIEGTAG